MKTGKSFSKKGQTAIDLITVIFVLLVVAISTVLGNMLLSEIDDEVQSDSSVNPQSKNFMSQVSNQYPVYMDNAFIIMLSLFWILLIVSSLFIDTHPIFFIVTVFLLLFVFVVGMLVSNAYEEVIQDGDFITFSDDFPKINWVMSNLLIVAIVMGFSAGLALYAKSQAGGGSL